MRTDWKWVRRLTDRLEVYRHLDELSDRQSARILRARVAIREELTEIWRRWDERQVGRWTFCPPVEAVELAPNWCWSVVVRDEVTSVRALVAGYFGKGVAA